MNDVEWQMEKCCAERKAPRNYRMLVLGCVGVGERARGRRVRAAREEIGFLFK